MAIIAKVRIRTSQTDLFEPGESITGLTADEEQELLEAGLAEVGDDDGSDLEKHSKKDLIAMATELNIEGIKETMSKTEIIAKIKEAS